MLKVSTLEGAFFQKLGQCLLCQKSKDFLVDADGERSRQVKEGGLWA